MSNRRSNKTPVPWRNADCTNCLKGRKIAEKACRRNTTKANKITYKRLRAVLAWRRFGRVQKTKSKFTRKHPPLLTNASGIEIQNPSETRKIFGEAIASISATKIYTQDFERYKRTQKGIRINFTKNNEEPYNTPFFME